MPLSSSDFQNATTAVNLRNALTEVENRKYGGTEFQSVNQMPKSGGLHPITRSVEEAGVETPLYSTDGDFFVVTSVNDKEMVLTIKENLDAGTLIQYTDNITHTEHTGVVVKDKQKENGIYVQPISYKQFTEIRQHNPSQRLVRINDDSFRPAKVVKTHSAKKLAAVIPLLEPAEKLAYFIYAKLFGNFINHHDNKIHETYLIFYIFSVAGVLILLFTIWTIATYFA